MNKAKSFSGASRRRELQIHFRWRVARRPPAKNRLLGTRKPPDDEEGKTAPEINRSGTCLTRGHRGGQQVAPKHESGSRPKVLTFDLTQVSNLRASNGNFIRTGIKRFSRQFVPARYRLRLKRSYGRLRSAGIFIVQSRAANFE